MNLPREGPRSGERTARLFTRLGVSGVVVVTVLAITPDVNVAMAAAALALSIHD